MPDVKTMLAIAAAALLVDIFVAPSFKGGETRQVPEAEAVREQVDEPVPLVLSGEGW